MAAEPSNDVHGDYEDDRQRAWTAALKVGYAPLTTEQLPIRFRALLDKLDGTESLGLPEGHWSRRRHAS